MIPVVFQHLVHQLDAILHRLDNHLPPFQYWDCFRQLLRPLTSALGYWLKMSIGCPDAVSNVWY